MFSAGSMYLRPAIQRLSCSYEILIFCFFASNSFRTAGVFSELHSNMKAHEWQIFKCQYFWTSQSHWDGSTKVYFAIRNSNSETCKTISRNPKGKINSKLIKCIILNSKNGKTKMLNNQSSATEKYYSFLYPGIYCVLNWAIHASNTPNKSNKTIIPFTLECKQTISG